MCVRVNLVRIMLWSSLGYALVFAATRAALPPRPRRQGRTPAGVAADHIKHLYWGDGPCVRDGSKPVE